MPANNGAYTNRAVAHIGASQIDSTLAVGDNLPAVATVVVRIPIVSGAVFLDLNRNFQRDLGEDGTGLSLFVKLVRASTPGGPALQAVSVNGSTGTFGFTNVAPGIYLLVVDENNTLSDVTPGILAGWIGTKMPDLIRTNVVVTSVDLPDQDFGLINGTLVAGRVFGDTGVSGGSANDGVMNGGETGIPGVTVRLMNQSGSTNYDTAITDGNGRYTLLVPAAITNGTVLQVVEVNPGGYLSTGASAGNTAGSYNRAGDTVTFTLTTSAIYAGVNS